MFVAGPNLTTDRILTIDELRPGEVLRFNSARVIPGGKGVNLARVAAALRRHATLVAFAPGRTGRAVVELIREEGLDVVDVPTDGEVRAASLIVETNGRITVLNEPGPRITPERWAAYESTVVRALEGHGFLICLGSAPPGSPPDAYARLVRSAREQGVRVAVDASGELLAATLQAGPDLVTPNLAEAEDVLHGRGTHAVDLRGPEVPERALTAAGQLVGRGALTAVVTAGGAGVAVATESRSWWRDAPRVEARNPIGAGDSFLAGLVGGLEAGSDLEGALRIGLAAAAASVETELPGSVDPERLRELVALMGA
jgi:1-phosphofructokinase family hexose kinase